MTASTARAARQGTASLYLRLSREADETSTGLGSQEADCRALAERLGLAVVAVHTDDGESGSLRSRPGFLAWLEDGREGRASVLIAHKVDRVGRDHGALSAFRDVLDGRTGDRKGGPVVRFVSAADGLDSEAPAWPLLIGTLGGLAEAERVQIAARIRRSRVALKAEGRWTGGTVPFGFAAVPNPAGAGLVLAPEPVEVEALRAAGLRVLAGASLASAARWLTDTYPPRRAAAWSRVTLRQVLTGPAASEAFTAAERRGLAEALKPGASDPRKGRRLPARLLSGALSCHACGARLQVARRTDGSVTYRCQSGAEGRGCPAPVSVSAEAVEAYVSEAFPRLWATVPETEAVRVEDQTSEALEAAEAEVERLGAAMLAARGAERLAAVEALEAAEAEVERLAALPVSALSVVRETGRSVGDAWHAGSLEARRDLLLSALGGPLVLGPGRRGPRGFDPARFVGAEDRLAPSWQDRQAEDVEDTRGALEAETLAEADPAGLEAVGL